MFAEIEAIAALGASISLFHRPESLYYSSEEKWTFTAELIQGGAGIRVEVSAVSMGECIQLALAKFHTLRQKGFVVYALALPKPHTPDDYQAEGEPEAGPIAATADEEIPF